MHTFLPYPDYKESAAVLSDEDLAQQVEDIITIIKLLLVLENHSEYSEEDLEEVYRWETCEMQLCEFGLTCVEEMQKRGLKAADEKQWLEWALDCCSENDNMGKPSWFGDVDEHMMYREVLLERDPDRYSVVFDG